LIRFNKNHKRGLYQTLRRQLYHCSTDSKKLESQGIVPVIKDEIESARLAGFGVFGSGNQQLFIHESEEREALKIVQKALAGLGL
jgi:hypothetical protein